MYQTMELGLVTMNVRGAKVHQAAFIVNDFDKVSHVDRNIFACEVAKYMVRQGATKKDVVVGVKSAIFADKKGRIANLCKDINDTILKVAYEKAMSTK